MAAPARPSSHAVAHPLHLLFFITMLAQLQRSTVLRAAPMSIPTLSPAVSAVVRLASYRCYTSAAAGVATAAGGAQARTKASSTGSGTPGALPPVTPSSSLFTGRNPVRFWPASLSNAAASSASAAAPSRSPSSSSSSSSSSLLLPSSVHPRRFSSVISQQVSEYARQPQKGLTLRELLAVGPTPTKDALLASARFLHRELPIRLAKRVKELESLPYGLSQMPPVLKVRSGNTQTHTSTCKLEDSASMHFGQLPAAALHCPVHDVFCISRSYYLFCVSFGLLFLVRFVCIVFFQ